MFENKKIKSVAMRGMSFGHPDPSRPAHYATVFLPRYARRPPQLAQKAASYGFQHGFTAAYALPASPLFSLTQQG